MVLMATTVCQSARIAVVGGGASGIFAAIHGAAAAAATAAVGPGRGGGGGAGDVVVLEATPQLLKKVKISGGGRCNVLHDHTKSADELLAGYPRGQRELRGILSKHFPAPAAAAWFEQHDVMLKTEEDGRMFPTTDSSQTVIDALLRAARQAGVEIQTRALVESIEWVEGKNENEEINVATTATTTTTRRGSFRIHYRRKKENDGGGGGGDSTSVPCLLQDVDAVILATGSSPAGYALLRQSGALLSSFNNDQDDDNGRRGGAEDGMMVATVPSLFTLRTSNELLDDLAGISVPHATISYRPPVVVVAATGPSSHHHDRGDEIAAAAVVAATHDDDDGDANTTSQNNNKNKNHGKQEAASAGRRKRGRRRREDNNVITQAGALLITHDRGLSGPAALRLSAFAAFAMAEHQYKGALFINWLGATADENSVFDNIWSMTTRHSQRTLGHSCPVDESHAIPKRLWWALVEKAAGLDRNKRWADLSKLQAKALTCALVQCPLDLVGKGTFKDEFVTAGGVSLSAIDMKTMQCKSRPGLFICGELVNVDGITGGYNFMNCWGTGYVAGRSARAYVEQQQRQQQLETL